MLTVLNFNNLPKIQRQERFNSIYSSSRKIRLNWSENKPITVKKSTYVGTPTYTVPKYTTEFIKAVLFSFPINDGILIGKDFINNQFFC